MHWPLAEQSPGGDGDEPISASPELAGRRAAEERAYSSLHQPGLRLPCSAMTPRWGSGHGGSWREREQVWCAQRA